MHVSNVTRKRRITTWKYGLQRCNRKKRFYVGIAMRNCLSRRTDPVFSVHHADTNSTRDANFMIITISNRFGKKKCLDGEGFTDDNRGALHAIF